MMTLQDVPPAVGSSNVTTFDQPTTVPRPFRILIIDDDPHVTAAMARKLGGEGFDIITATSARRGLWRFLTGEPDAVITDLSMPEITGVEIVENIRQHSSRKHIPIIVLTGMVTDDLTDRLLGIGATAVLNKPASSTELLVAIGQALPPAAALSER